ncbi:hypothetical protein FAZ15_22330 [Sphingobacterium olei]|uniref:DUF6966 domain-containing protein n=1 Tax=Sphingobacterium olei TaxID=2571155 RepID=A0A4U0N6B0_9SPHI|nr:hypothetical protein [Sphingobacterium olei]TJZ49309.1 hypothetical protein FAZ15_22330 [Sphingobacterium olei]
MTDHYKISLEILYRLLKESGNDHWANWIQKDIHLWTTEKRVDNHLGAYGGMGSINDLSVGGSDTIGVWKNRIFDTTKNLIWSLAKGKISTPPLDDKFYRCGSTEISGWRCRSCGHSRIDKSNIELYLSTEFLPKLFVDYIRQDQLIEILDLNTIVALDQIVEKRSTIEKLIQNANITLTNGNEWLWNCPECESKNICVFKWQTMDNDTKLIESKDNLKMETKKNASL